MSRESQLKKVKPSARSPTRPSEPWRSGEGRFHLPGSLLAPVLFLLIAYSLTSLGTPSPVLATSLYNRTPWPEVMRGLTEEEDNTGSLDAVHPCFRTQGRSFKITNNSTVKLSGISVYVYLLGRNEGRFDRTAFRLSLRDSSNQPLVTNNSSTYAGLIYREDSGSPTFEVFFPLNLNIAGGVPYTFILECLSDDPDLYRISESSRVSDGETSYHDSLNSQSTPYYMSGRKILYTTFAENFAAHFPALASSTNYPLPTTNSSPKYHPVIFVHGLGGTPGAFDGSQDPSRNYVKLLTDLGYPADYISLYSCGYKYNYLKRVNEYNYQGDIREIAQGLEVVVNSLSDKHKAQGGDGRVDIVAHSLGNLVTRQYLLTHKDNHRIRRYVGVGAPFKGAWVMGVDKGIKSLLLIGKPLESAIANFFVDALNKTRDPNMPLKKDSIASVQATPESDFLEGGNGLNRTTINNVEFYAIYGDINTKVRQKVFNVALEFGVDVGDGIVQAKSASYTGWVTNAKKYAFNDGLLLEAHVKKLNNAFAFEVGVTNPKSLKTLHVDLLSRQDSKSKLVCLISSDIVDRCN